MQRENINWNVVGSVKKWTQEQLDQHGDNVDQLVEPDSVVDFEGNLLLNDGIEVLLDLLVGAGGTAYNNGNARIGVGNGSGAADAAQTALLGASQNFQGQETGYPTVAGTTVTFQSKYGAGQADFDWNEWGIDNGTTLLNRKVVSLGTKAGGVWTLTVSVTIS